LRLHLVRLRHKDCARPAKADSLALRYFAEAGAQWIMAILGLLVEITAQERDILLRIAHG